jgi:hypothetical protein
MSEQGCPWDRKTCAWAAEGGHLEILKWLHKQGCPWNEDACAFAARGDELDILIWLREQGCPWNGKMLSFAKECNSRDVYKWLLNGCTDDEPSYTDLDEIDDESMDVLGTLDDDWEFEAEDYWEDFSNYEFDSTYDADEEYDEYAFEDSQ